MLIPHWWYNIEIPSLHPPTAYAVPNQKLLTATSFMATLYTLHETKHLDRPVTLTNLCPLTSMNLPLWLQWTYTLGTQGVQKPFYAVNREPDFSSTRLLRWSAVQYCLLLDCWPPQGKALQGSEPVVVSTWTLTLKSINHRTPLWPLPGWYWTCHQGCSEIHCSAQAPSSWFKSSGWGIPWY